MALSLNLKMARAMCSVAARPFCAVSSKGSQLLNIPLANLMTQKIDVIPRVTVLISCPKANHYLVGEEKDNRIIRVGCVQMKSIPVPIGEDVNVKQKLQQFIDKFTSARYSFVDAWPDLKAAGELQEFSYITKPRQPGENFVRLKHRSVVMLTGPHTSMCLYIYSTTQDKIQTLTSEKCFVDMAIFATKPTGPRNPSILYLPHAHFGGDPKDFQSLGVFSEVDLNKLKLALIEAHDGNPFRVSASVLEELYIESVKIEFPEGHIFVTIDTEDDCAWT